MYSYKMYQVGSFSLLSDFCLKKTRQTNILLSCQLTFISIVGAKSINKFALNWNIVCRSIMSSKTVALKKSEPEKHPCALP